MTRSLRKRIYYLLLICALCIGHMAHSQIVLEFCPVTKIQASKNWGGTMTIRNNTGVVLDLANNDFNMDWPSLVSLQWPFSDGVQNGINWSFKINLDWPGSLAVGASASKNISGNIFSGVLQFPTSGTYTQGGIDYEVTINHCNQTNPYELYDATVEFDRNCFIYSPTSNLCLGEAATEVWQGEGIYDVMVPTDRPSWAIATMVAHRLFTNMAGGEMLSPNFWTATALNESRMTCDNTIVPNRQNHCYINSGVGACQGDGIGNMGGTTNGNCFQILNIGYTQLENNQPDLFAQTNAYGTASYNTVVADGHWETGAIAVAYYHYQDIRYWNQIYCWNTNAVFNDSQDPYAIEKIFYHAYHDGPNAGIQLLNQIDADYANAVAATNMNTVVAGNGTWASTNTGSQKVGNFTSLLDGNGVIYPQNKTDYTTEYYGCYTEDIKWTDVLYYLNEVKILYPHLMDPTVQADIQAVFDGLNGGTDVPFANFGPVIDEIVIQMGGHDPSSYIATQYGASKTCGENPVGVALRSNDTLCPGESGFLEVWLAGDPNFRVDIQYPDGSTNTFSGISSSPYYIPITQPGDYEVVYFEDNDEVGDINCNFAAITVESRNSAIVGWDKSSVDPITGCASGDLIINKQGDDPITVSYTLDGASQPDINLGAGDLSQTVSGSPAAGEYIITTMSPNFCGTPINDTIEFCTTTPCTPPTYTILTPDTSICDGATANIRLSFGGTGPFDLYYTSSTSGPQSVTGIVGNSHSISLTTAQTIQVDSVVEGTCVNDASSSVILTVNPLPIVDLGNDTTICSGASLMLDAQNAGATYTWSTTESSQTITVNSANNFSVQVTDGNGCVASDDIDVNIQALPVVDLGNDTTICSGASLTLDAQNAGATYLWSTTESSQTISVNSASTYTVQVTDGFDCVGTDDIDVSIQALPVVDLGNDTTICSGATLTLDAQNAGATYLWSTTESSQTISVNSASTYSVQVTDGFDCVGTDEIDVSIQALPVVDLGNDTTICNGATLTLDAQNAGATYTWSTTESSQSITVNSANTYSVQVTDANLCVGSDDIIVSLSPNLPVDLGNDTAICSGFSLVLDAQFPGSTYVWSTTESSQTISVNSAGNYSVQVTDVGGCTGTDDITISIVSLPVVNLGNDTTLCDGASLSLDAQNVGANYSWSTTATTQTISVNTANNYAVQVTDGNGCVATDDINVSIQSLPVVNLGNDTTICNGATLTLDAQNAGATYAWSTTETSQTISVNAAGLYSVQVTDGFDCVGTDDIDVSIAADLPVDLGIDTSICSGSTLTLDAGYPGSNYTWNTTETSQKISVNSAGNYSVQVTDLNGCSGTDDINVAIVTSLPVDLGNDTSICSGETIILDAQFNGSNYTWNTTETSQTISVNSAGNYTVQVTDVSGCTGTDDINIGINSLPVVDLGNDTTICDGTTLTLDASNAGAAFLWNTTETTQTIDVTSNGNYSVTVTDGNECSSTDDIDVSISVVGAVTITIPSEICSDNGIVNIVTSPSGGVLSGNGVSGNQFDPQDASVILDASTTITYDYTNGDDCSAQSSEDILVHSVPTPVQTVGDATICLGDAITLTVNPSGSNTIEWFETGSVNVIGSNSDLIVTTSGSYYTVESNGICSTSSDTTTIDVVNADVSGIASPSQTIDLGESVSLSVVNPSGAYTYSWFDNNNGSTQNGSLISVSPLVTTTYTLTGVLGGCLATFDLTIEVKTPVLVPNAFTPNGDGENDGWEISGIETYPNAKVQIFNRWGTRVYHTVGEYIPWTGIRDGKLMPIATYYYIIELNDSEGVVLNGSVTLVL